MLLCIKIIVVGFPVQIGVFKDKLFVYNTGHLPQHWTIETIISEHRSVPYNPEIANVFFKAGLIESWGRGIEKVIISSKKYNGYDPEFSWNNGLNVEFKSNYPNKVGNKVGNNITDNQHKIINYIKQDSKISAGKLSSIIGISKRKIEDNLSKLKSKKILKRVGGTRGYWIVKYED